jgi:2'-5' RNA ligase
LAQAAEPLRLFFALWPPEELQGRLAAWAKQATGRGRAMRRENIHLTLAFLGATDPELLPMLVERARAVRFAPIGLMLDRVGYWRHNRIIWCGTDNEPQALTALVAGLRAGLGGAGIRSDPKPFVSHLTLVREATGLPRTPAWVPLVWEAQDFVLVSSVRVEGRIRYQVMRRFPAQAG